MNRLASALLLVLFWATSLGAHADPLTGKGELGLVLARGNTTSETFNAKADISKVIDPWKHTFGFSYLHSQSRDLVTGIDETSGNRYELHEQSDLKVSPRSYVFESLRYENDDFAPFEYQAIGTLGYGYKWIDSETTKLATEIGAGYRRAREAATGEQKGDAVGRGEIDFESKLTATTKAFDKFLVEAGSDNTFTQNELGVAVSMTQKLALSVTYLVRHNSDVPPTTPPQPPIKKTDQLLTVNLVFAF